MNAIVIVDKNFAIGKDGGLLCHLSKELKYFKEKTIGKVIVLGRKTLDTFPNKTPLEGRTNILLTSNLSYKNDKCEVCYGIADLDEKLKKYDTKDVFIAGGESIYHLFINRCDTLYITKIDYEFKADKYFPNVDEMKDFSLVSESEPIEENGYTYKFCIYKRNN